MTSDIPSLARRATMQVRSGLEKLRDGDLLGAEVMLRAGMASLASVEALITAETEPPHPAKPARLLSLVDAETPELDDDFYPVPAWGEEKR
jgi:hypothetical protein